MDQHFQEYPNCEQFRDEVPEYFDYVSEIFGDRLATRENAHGPDSMGEDEIELLDEEQEGEPVDNETITPTVENHSSIQAHSAGTQSHSASRSVSASTSGNSSAIAFSANPKDTPKLNKTLGKRMAERKLEMSKEGPPKRRRTKQAKIDALAAETVKVEERSEAVLRAVLSEALDKIVASNTSSTAAAIETFKKELKGDFYSDVFRVYRLLRQPEMAETFLALDDTERANWLRFELGSMDR